MYIFCNIYKLDLYKIHKFNGSLLFTGFSAFFTQHAKPLVWSILFTKRSLIFHHLKSSANCSCSPDFISLVDKYLQSPTACYTTSSAAIRGLGSREWKYTGQETATARNVYIMLVQRATKFRGLKECSHVQELCAHSLMNTVQQFARKQSPSWNWRSCQP